jgi:hypothetical protein
MILVTMEPTISVEYAVPPRNVEIYRALFTIETVLRELIIDALSTVAGPRWWKTRLSPEGLRQFKENLEKERRTTWTSNIPHHPIYYVGLPDLRASIEQRNNWQEVFRNVFPRDKDLVTTDLFELESIRNKVAHNRQATASDEEIVHTARLKLRGAIGTARFDELAARCTSDGRIGAQLRELKRECDVSYALVALGKSLGRLASWSQADGSWWWFDSDFLGCSVGRVSRWFRLLGDYREARTTQQPDEAKAWLSNHEGPSIYQGARRELAELLVLWKSA